MQPIKLELLFSIPLPEDKMHSGSPLRWKAGDLMLETNLFVYHHYMLFNTLASAIKLYESDGTRRFDLIKFLDVLNNPENPNALETKNILIDAIEEYKSTYGTVPHDIVELIVSVSDVVDKDSAYQFYCNWMDENKEIGIVPDALEWNNSKFTRNQCLINFIKRTVDLDSILDLLSSIQKVNITVKKKLTGTHEQATQAADDLKTYKKRLSGFWGKKERPLKIAS